MLRNRPLIVVWFSCGAASAVAAYETLRRYGDTHDIRIVNNVVIEEHRDNMRFLADCQTWFGQPIEFAFNSKYPTASAEDVWSKRSYMSGIAGAPCTDLLKKTARNEWEQNNHFDWNTDQMVLGFTADEQSRHDMFVLTERNNVIPVLIDAGYTKQDCIDIVAAHGIKLPEMYALGYPNANCLGCVKATSPTYWNHLRKTHPDIFWRRAVLSYQIGARLVRYKGERIFLHQLPADAVGRPLASLKMPECGIICEEYRQEPHDNA